MLIMLLFITYLIQTEFFYLNFVFLLKIYGSISWRCILVDCATTHTILSDKKYFSNLTLIPFNIQIISSPVDLIKGSERATIFLPNGTKFPIDNAHYSNKSNRNLLSFKDIFQNGYHIETINHNGNEYLLITEQNNLFLHHMNYIKQLLDLLNLMLS